MVGMTSNSHDAPEALHAASRPEVSSSPSVFDGSRRWVLASAASRLAWSEAFPVGQSSTTAETGMGSSTTVSTT